MEGLDTLKISEDKKKYIVDLLNPVLEEMVAECIHRMPDDPVRFMLEWLEQKKVTDEDKMLSSDEKDRIKKENADLKDSISRVQSQMQEAAKLAAGPAVEDDDEDEEGDDDDELTEPPPNFMKEPSQKARASVSAEAYGDWNTKKAFRPPVITKTDDQKQRITKCLSTSFMFSNLDAMEMNVITLAMREKTTKPGERVIMQGEAGEKLYVVESGKLECKREENGLEKILKTCTAGDVFGELALLYNCPRAASVDSVDACVLWQLDRDTFNHIVKESAQMKRIRYESFLSKVPLLASMDVYERSQLADAIKSEMFDNGANIVNQGEVGHKFYIIEEGLAFASKGGNTIMEYGVGDYFGELALIRDQPRAATVTAKENLKVLCLDRASFKRLLNVSDLLDRSTKYA